MCLTYQGMPIGSLGLMVDQMPCQFTQRMGVCGEVFEFQSPHQLSSDLVGYFDHQLVTTVVQRISKMSFVTDDWNRFLFYFFISCFRCICKLLSGLNRGLAVDRAAHSFARHRSCAGGR